MPNRTVTIVMAGGVGSRLHPLTEERAKPAVPFGGKYRIIDFTLSNCLHSGLRRILVFTQYKSQSLSKHLRDGWSIFNPQIGEYITVVPPQMRTGNSWYEGTADAVYQNLYMLKRSGAEQVLILSGDHIYRMDYAEMLRFHRKREADLTIACMQVPREEASSFGVMETTADGRVVDFVEKPDVPPTLPDDPSRSLASMGIYVFSIDRLIAALEEDALREDSSHDFGNDIIPRLIQSDDVYGYQFGGCEGRVSVDGYWRDVGTIDAYYDANMDLLDTKPAIDLYQPNWPILGAACHAPPARVVPGESLSYDAIIDNSALGAGSVVAGATVQNSIISGNVRIEEGAIISDAIIFDDVKVSEGAQLKRCIVDKNVTIPPGERIGFDPIADARRFSISEQGIVVVPRDYQFPDRDIPLTTRRPRSKSRAALVQ